MLRTFTLLAAGCVAVTAAAEQLTCGETKGANPRQRTGRRQPETLKKLAYINLNRWPHCVFRKLSIKLRCN